MAGNKFFNHTDLLITGWGYSSSAGLQWFGAIERTISHVSEKSARCRLVDATVALPMETEERASVDAQAQAEMVALRERGKRRHVSDVPAIRMPGPFLHEAVAAGVDHQRLLRTGAKLQLGPTAALGLGA